LHVEAVFEVAVVETEVVADVAVIVVVVVVAEARLDSDFVVITNVSQNSNVRILKIIVNDLCLYNLDKEKKDNVLLEKPLYIVYNFFFLIIVDFQVPAIKTPLYYTTI
jgi:hypothetical protein